MPYRVEMFWRECKVEALGQRWGQFRGYWAVDGYILALPSLHLALFLWPGLRLQECALGRRLAPLKGMVLSLPSCSAPKRQVL